MTNNESGRSMVEMLGVLAIIGVLSVMGIAGYTQAMKKYKANEILNTASMMAVIAKSANGGQGTTLADLGKAGLTTPVADVNMSADGTGAVASISITGASALGLCDMINAAANADTYTITCS